MKREGREMRGLYIRDREREGRERERERERDEGKRGGEEKYKHKEQTARMC